MRNWTIQEAVRVMNAGTDTEAMKEIITHFPMFAVAAARNDLAAVAELMTSDKFTLNRLAKEPGNVNGEDAGEEAPAKTESGKSEKKAEAPAANKSLDEMTTKELMKLCDARGIKVPHYGKTKQFYIEALQGAGEENTSGEDAGDDGDEADPYEGKGAKELYTMCKDRGIKVETKKAAKVYADLLRKADAEAEADGDDDWGDEAEEEAPKKADKKPAAKKTEKKEEKAEDDEWDI